MFNSDALFFQIYWFVVFSFRCAYWHQEAIRVVKLIARIKDECKQNLARTFFKSNKEINACLLYETLTKWLKGTSSIQKLGFSVNLRAKKNQTAFKDTFQRNHMAHTVVKLSLISPYEPFDRDQFTVFKKKYINILKIIFFKSTLERWYLERCIVKINS